MKKSVLTQRVAALVAAKDAACSVLDDAQALDCLLLFPVWTVNKAYIVGDRCRYGEKLYRCVQAHTALDNWTPDATPALWTEVAKPGEIPVWRQPTGAQDAYNTGDKVKFPDENGSVYVSTVDANVWAPDVYGWTLA